MSLSLSLVGNNPSWTSAACKETKSIDVAGKICKTDKESGLIRVSHFGEVSLTHRELDIANIVHQLTSPHFLF